MSLSWNKSSWAYRLVVLVLSAGLVACGGGGGGGTADNTGGNTGGNGTGGTGGTGGNTAPAAVDIHIPTRSTAVEINEGFVSSYARLAGVTIAPNGMVLAGSYYAAQGIRQWNSIDALLNGDASTPFATFRSLEGEHRYEGIEAIAANSEYVAVAVTEGNMAGANKGFVVLYPLTGGQAVAHFTTASGTTFHYPRGVAFARNTGTDLYIADDRNNRVVKCKLADGPVCSDFITNVSGSTDNGEGFVKGVAVDRANGDVWVSNWNDCQIQRYTSNGLFRSSRNTGQEACPIDLTVANFGNASGSRDVLVGQINRTASPQTSKVTVFTGLASDNSFSEYGSPIDLNNNGPWGIAVDVAGNNVILVDSHFQQLQKTRLVVLQRPLLPLVPLTKPIPNLRPKS